MTAQTIVYKAVDMDRVELCQPIDSANFERIRGEINGVSRRSTWQPIAMELIHKDEGKRLRQSDSPWLGTNALIFRARAIEAMTPMLQDHGELLPLECAEAALFIYNPTRVIDALDYATSSVDRLDDGQIYWIAKYVFHAERIADIDVFKLPIPHPCATLVSQRFVDQWQGAGLTGLEFERIWPAIDP